MRIVATKVRAEELKPGDLFSTAGPEYWDWHGLNLSIGERVYIRTNRPCPADQANDTVYRIEIHQEPERKG